MPKFFSPSSSSEQTENTASKLTTPADLIHQNTTEIGHTTEHPMPEMHDSDHPTFFHQPTNHNIDAPTEMDFSLPKEDEPLLPSPLDTPELPAPHENQNPVSTEVTTEKPEEHHGPIFKPQPLTTNITFSPTPFSVAQSQGFAGFPLPESQKVETLMTWRAPSRPHRKKNRSFYTTVAILIILIALISLLAGERMLVAVLFALMFLVYVLNFIEPGEVDYKISTQGVTIDDHFYHWQEMDSFWFEKKDGYTVLHIFTQLKFPTMLMLVLGPDSKEEEVRKIVARFLPYHEIPPKSLIERWGEGLQRYFPLENPHK